MSLAKREPNLSGRKLNRALTFVLVVSLVLVGTYFISAQEDTRPDRSQRQRGRGQRGEGGRRQFDPAQMVERQTQRAIEGLNLSSEETAVLEPKIKAIAQNRIAQRQEMQPLIQALRAAVDGGDEAEIKSALETLKAKREAHKAKSEALEANLVELLTLRQEAQLTITGIVNNDDGFGGFGGRGGFGGGRRRGGDGRGRPGGGEGRRGGGQ
ncbi:MAG: hypothetical protein O7E52_05695 [Candidatus Poribacteria bacterium]|nr:hypothetical protein [Candidatus Poribacteria bacterium]